jgi:putative ABC transport system ATP-binding protein
MTARDQPPAGRAGNYGTPLDADARYGGVMDALVRLTDVSKRYDGDGSPAVAHVNLVVARGEAVAIMGPSGSGKSTLLNLIAGLDRPTSGSIEAGGERIDALSETGSARYRRRQVGMIFQFFNLLDDLPALDNVALAGQLVGLKARPARQRAAALMDELGIADRRDIYPASLSGGERQRVAVARALMNRPALLLADEPTGALDSRSGEAVVELLTGLNRIGQTLVLVTHDPRLAAQCASRVVEIEDGRIARESVVESAR